MSDLDQAYATPAGMDVVGHPGARAVPWKADSFRSTLRIFNWFHWSGSALNLLGIALIAVGMIRLFSLINRHAVGAPPSDLLQSVFIFVIPGYLILFLGGALLTTALVFMMIQLYRMWSVVVRTNGPTTPGKAVGFMFIPFFNFYWVFVAWRSLAVEIDGAATASGKAGPPIGSGLATAFCILFIFLILPYLGPLAFIPLMIIVPILMRRLTEGTIRLLSVTPHA